MCVDLCKLELERAKNFIAQRVMISNIKSIVHSTHLPRASVRCGYFGECVEWNG